MGGHCPRAAQRGGDRLIEKPSERRDVLGFVEVGRLRKWSRVPVPGSDATIFGGERRSRRQPLDILPERVRLRRETHGQVLGDGPFVQLAIEGKPLDERFWLGRETDKIASAYPAKRPPAHRRSRAEEATRPRLPDGKCVVANEPLHAPVAVTREKREKDCGVAGVRIESRRSSYALQIAKKVGAIIKAAVEADSEAGSIVADRLAFAGRFRRRRVLESDERSRTGAPDVDTIWSQIRRRLRHELRRAGIDGKAVEANAASQTTHIPEAMGRRIADRHDASKVMGLRTLFASELRTSCGRLNERAPKEIGSPRDDVRTDLTSGNHPLSAKCPTSRSTWL